MIRKRYQLPAGLGALTALPVEVAKAIDAPSSQEAAEQQQRQAAQMIQIVVSAIEQAMMRSGEIMARMTAESFARVSSQTTAELTRAFETKLSQPFLTQEQIERAVQEAIGHVSGALVKELGGKLKDVFSAVLRVPGPSTMRTYALPFLGALNDGSRTEAIRVATAGTEPYEVIVRTVHPPGSFSAFSFDAQELNALDPPLIGPDITAPPFGGDVLVLPGGQFQLIRLRPKQALFAKGNIGPNFFGAPAVIASITTGDFAAMMSSGVVPFASAG